MTLASNAAVMFIFGLGSFGPWWGRRYFNDGQASQNGRRAQAARTISGYISKAPATGAFCMVFFFPLMHMWMIPKPECDNGEEIHLNSCLKMASVLSLIMFQINFGLFLSTPNIYNAYVHATVVFVFAVNGLFYFAF